MTRFENDVVEITSCVWSICQRRELGALAISSSATLSAGFSPRYLRYLWEPAPSVAPVAECDLGNLHDATGFMLHNIQPVLVFGRLQKLTPLSTLRSFDNDLENTRHLDRIAGIRRITPIILDLERSSIARLGIETADKLLTQTQTQFS